MRASVRGARLCSSRRLVASQSQETCPMRNATLGNARTRVLNQRSRDRFIRPRVERLEGRLVLATVFGVTDSNALIQFDSATPGTIVSSTPITGLVAGDSIQGIDYRPATGQLFALGG